MGQEDRQRWDEKWTELAGESFEPHPLLIQSQALLIGGVALDLACGKGQNAVWLAQQGYEVLAVDISPVALDLGQEEAKSQGVQNKIRFKQVDLEGWQVPALAFDLICVFRFLDRQLFSSVRAGLHPGGYLFYSTRHVGILDRFPEANRSFLLERNELVVEFGDWKILHYREGEEEAELIAQKPEG